MARDLIPPPSPAGRPAPEGVPRLIELPPEREEQVEAYTPPPPRRLPPSRFRNRFGFMVGALAGVAIAVAAVLVAVFATGGPPDEGLAKNWSTWKPLETSITGGPADIAAHIAPMYRLDDGTQIAQVKGGPLELDTPSGTVKLDVALRPATGNIQTYDDKAVMYTLNGLGPDGSIASGAPSQERHRLLRREALELALYSFRYLPGVKMVVTLLPPKALSAKEQAAIESGAEQEPAKQAVFYRPGDLKPELEVPLSNTVPNHTPRPDSIPAAESHKIDTLTLGNLFTAQFTIAQDLTTYLVLQRVTQ